MTADLISRLKNAKGPDRELDAMIMAEFAGRDVYEDGRYIVAKARYEPYDTLTLGWIDPCKVSRNFSIHWDISKTPAYTASTDAAIALLSEKLPTHCLTISIDPTSVGAKIWWFPDGLAGEAESGPYEAVATTPAIAILIALFEALSTEDDE